MSSRSHELACASEQGKPVDAQLSTPRRPSLVNSHGMPRRVSSMKNRRVSLSAQSELGGLEDEGDAGELRVVVVPESVQVFVDVRDAVLLELMLPGLGGQVVRGDAVVAVKRYELRGFLVEGHPRQQVRDAVLDGEFGIFVRILDAVFVQIDPAVMVDVPSWVMTGEPPFARQSS